MRWKLLADSCTRSLSGWASDKRCMDRSNRLVYGFLLGCHVSAVRLFTLLIQHRKWSVSALQRPRHMQQFHSTCASDSVRWAVLDNGVHRKQVSQADPTTTRHGTNHTFFTEAILGSNSCTWWVDSFQRHWVSKERCWCFDVWAGKRIGEDVVKGVFQLTPYDKSLKVFVGWDLR